MKLVTLYSKTGRPTRTVMDGMSGKRVSIKIAVLASLIAQTVGHTEGEWPMYVDTAKEVLQLVGSARHISAHVQWTKDPYA